MDKNRAIMNAVVRTEVIDFINRHNLYFDQWDYEKLADTFTDDAAIDHPIGQASGRSEINKLLKDYEPITRGVRRENANYVIDVISEGKAIVHYHSILIRVTREEDAAKARETSGFLRDTTGFPILICHALVTDTVVQDKNANWKVFRKKVEQVVVNDDHFRH
jgi:hypothetical protein